MVELYKKPYDEPPVSDYLKSFYSSGGGVEFTYLKGAEYILCECDECRLVFQKQVPNEFLMKRLYEQWISPEKAFRQHQEIDGLDRYTYYAREIATVMAYLGKIPSQLRFLDFGMGWGKWALMAKAFGCESYGTELSEERIKYAQSTGIKTVAWEEISEYSFDFINTEQVFEHITAPLDTLIHLGGALKDNGIIKISVPTARNIRKRLKRMDWQAEKGTRNSLNPVAPLEHINCFGRKSLLKMATMAGLEEVSMPLKTQYQFMFNLRGVRSTAKNLLLPIYRNVLKRQNYVFFRKTENHKHVGPGSLPSK